MTSSAKRRRGAQRQMPNGGKLSAANVRRQSEAALVACAQVQYALEVLGSRAPQVLADAGRLRLRHPLVSLQDLGALADPPLSKDAVAGRLRRLVAKAESAGDGEHG